MSTSRSTSTRPPSGPICAADDKETPDRQAASQTTPGSRRVLGMRPVNILQNTPIRPNNRNITYRTPQSLHKPFKPPTLSQPSTGRPDRKPKIAVAGLYNSTPAVANLSKGKRRHASDSSEDDFEHVGMSRKGCADDPFELESDEEDHKPPYLMQPRLPPTETYHIVININVHVDINGQVTLPSDGVDRERPKARTEAESASSLSSDKTSLELTRQAAARSEPRLSKQQEHILQRVRSGKNVLIHGSAGTGKSVLIRAIRRVLAELEAAAAAPKRASETGCQTAESLRTVEAATLKPEAWKLAVTAPTGMAAINVGGSTLHSFLGAGLCKGPIDKVIATVRGFPPAVRRLRTTSALIIDEISMVHGNFFDRVNEITSAIRDDTRPFGHLQMIICGDFMQIPPVPEEDEDGIKKSKYAFESEVWARMFEPENVFTLTENFRSEDPDFFALLDRLRLGDSTQSDYVQLSKLSRKVCYQDDIQPVHLVATRAQADTINEERLSILAGPNFHYTAQDIPGVDERGLSLGARKATELLNKQTTWPEEISLRVGAQVMLLMNMPEEYLVNGTTGRIVDFKTLDEAEAEHIALPEYTCWAGPRNKKFPVIRFAKMDNCESEPPQRMLMPTMITRVENWHGKVQATRIQVPLTLGWALTIHKAQGQNLDRVIVDLSKIFVPGQAYTALSRVRSSKNLQVIGLGSGSLTPDTRALEWIRKLEGRVHSSVEDEVSHGQSE